MLTFLKQLFWGGRDDARRRETSFHDKGRMLEMDEPMSAAGAQLSGERDKSETEQALKRASEQNAQQRR